VFQICSVPGIRYLNIAAVEIFEKVHIIYNLLLLSWYKFTNIPAMKLPYRLTVFAFTILILFGLSGCETTGEPKYTPRFFLTKYHAVGERFTNNVKMPISGFTYDVERAGCCRRWTSNDV